MSEYKEGFCLMQYECEGCGFIEYIWNSRDGITPYGVISPCCDKKSSTHINFQSDSFFSAIPNTASRVFVNMTLEKAEMLSQKFFDAHGEKLMEEYEHLREIGKDGLIESKTKEIYSGFGEGISPCTVSRKEYLSSIKE